MQYQRIAKIIAEEGVGGLWPRVRNRLLPKSTSADAEIRRQVVEEYHRSVSIFQEKVKSTHFAGLDRFLWYHAIDLRDGVVTPGVFDLRHDLRHFDFPDDMSGMTVLDVGSATGFFAFEFEKRGAQVTSVELPSIADWDMPSGEDRELTLAELKELHQAESLEDLHYLHLDGPFQFCHNRLRSKVTRCYSTIYDLTPAKLAHKKFDLVFLGDILLHLFSPLHALSAIAPLCNGQLIIMETMADYEESKPLMLYIGGASRSGDNRTWWLPNRACLTQMLKRVGFQTVEFRRHFHAVYRVNGSAVAKTVIHASRGT